MKRLILLLVTFAFAVTIDAQTLSGKVQDTNGQAVAFATISLLQPDSTLVTGAISDEDGAYTLSAAAGNYIVQVSFVGYATQTDNIHLQQSETKHFTLRPQTEELAEVEVQAKRPLVERQMDKLVMNISESPFAIGSNGQELLRKAPGVVIDKGGNITVNGKSVEIYINGRPSYMTGEQLKGMLQGTDGATIEKIEIITNPSAKYDAAGQGDMAVCTLSSRISM